jgi:hypothetical protein
MDVTIRVKDLLKLLNGMGLLRKIAESDMPTPDSGEQVFADGIRNPVESREAGNEDSASGDSNQDDDDVVQEAPPPRNSLGFASFGLMQRSSILNDDSTGRQSRRPSKYSSNHKSDGKEADVALNNSSDFQRCDLQVTALEVISLLAEVASPESSRALRWQVNSAEDQDVSDLISLLEYSEVEVVYSEFLRLLVAMADMGTSRDHLLRERFPLSKRFDAFMRHIFLPALHNPYTPPPPVDHVPEESSAKDIVDAIDIAAPVEEAGDPGNGAPAAQEDPPVEQDVDQEDAAAEEEQPVEPQQFEYWLGFDDDFAEAEASRAPRRWPDGYEQEVALWGAPPPVVEEEQPGDEP